jgi:hypothetical protein
MVRGRGGVRWCTIRWLEKKPLSGDAGVRSMGGAWG